MLEELEENELTERIIGLAIEVHKEYGGPGLKMLNLRVGLVLNFARSVFRVADKEPSVGHICYNLHLCHLVSS